MKRKDDYREPRDWSPLGCFLAPAMITFILLISALNGTATDATLIPGGWFSVAGVVFLSLLAGAAGLALLRVA